MGKKLGSSESRFLPQKCAKNRPHASANSKNFPGLYPGPPLKWVRGGMGRGLGKGRKGKERKRRGGEEGKGEVACLTFSFRCAAPANI